MKRQSERGDSVKTIAITSGKGGVGKSCVAGYMGAALARAGKKTLLLELGADARSLDVILPLSETALFHSGDLLSDRCSAEDAIAPVSGCDNLFVIPCALGRRQSVDEIGFRALLGALPEDFDFLLVDGLDAHCFPFSLADMVVQVVTPDSLCIRAAATATRLLRERGIGNIRLIINQVPANPIPIKGAEDFDDVIDQVGARLLAVIPHSPKLTYSSNNAAPLPEDSLTPRIFDRLAQRLLGAHAPLLVR
jgi:septum formation inhibitor-activating ATPase MinD